MLVSPKDELLLDSRHGEGEVQESGTHAQHTDTAPTQITAHPTTISKADEVKLIVVGRNMAIEIQNEYTLIDWGEDTWISDWLSFREALPSPDEVATVVSLICE